MQMICCSQKIVFVIKEKKTGQVLPSAEQAYIYCKVIEGAGITQDLIRNQV